MAENSCFSVYVDKREYQLELSMEMEKFIELRMDELLLSTRKELKNPTNIWLSILACVANATCTSSLAIF